MLAETVAAQGAEIDALTAELEDPAEIISAAHRSFVAARERSRLGWLLLRLDVSHTCCSPRSAPTPARDLRNGVKAGRFSLPHERSP